MTLESKSKWLVKGKNNGDVLETLLKNRGVKNTDAFLNPSIEEIPGFEKLFNSTQAAEKILKAVQENKKIVVYGDYDVDGITGVSILWSFLYFELLEILKKDKKDIEILPYIPNRFDEGYGLSENSLSKLEKEGVDLIITVDCGIRDKGLIKKYQDIEFIITDHHIPPEDILEDLNYTIVHQMYPKKEYPYQTVCGAFLSYLLILSIKSLLGLDSSLEKNKKYLDLVALATVTDMMPLTEINRVLVKYGLDVLRNTQNIGLKKLIEISSVELNEISAYHLGFVLGPRLNASGRLDLGMHSLKLLCTQNDSLASDLSEKLNNLNIERQDITKKILYEARKQVDENRLIIVNGDDWNEGVIGLVASKIQEEFNRPVIVFTKSNDELKGSARSISGINITEVIEKFSKYLKKFGGHSQAAGLSLELDKFSEFKHEIQNYIQDNFNEDIFKKVLEIDLPLETKLLTVDFAYELNKLEPFGYGNRKPVFLIENVVVVSKRVMGKDKNHMKIEFKGNGPGVDEAIFFHCLEDTEKIQEDDVLDLVGSIGINEWNGSVKVQFEVKEWRYCNIST